MLHRARRTVLIGCIAAWAGAFIATHIPAERLPQIGAGDRLLHALGFFVLGSFFLLTLAAHGVRSARRAVLVICVLAVYAALDEVTQELVNRYASLDDWLADVVGAVAAVILWEILLRVLAARKTRRSEAQ